MDDDLRRAIDEPVRIEVCDPGWPARFARERDRLLRDWAGSFAAVEHIGSTAVP